MSDQQSGKGGSETTRIKEEFSALPLGQKLSSLLEMEVVALNESISYVVNSPGEAFGKVGDALTDFGNKIGDEFKKATAGACATDSAAPETADETPGEKTKSSKKSGPKGEK
jgi:hypothetical protein